MRCWDDEKVEFLIEELQSTQEVLAQEQEERVKLQEELARSYREVQVLNKAPLERSTEHEREGDDPTRVPVAPGDQRSAALKALVAASRHRFEQALQANVPLQAESQPLVGQARSFRSYFPDQPPAAPGWERRELPPVRISPVRTGRRREALRKHAPDADGTPSPPGPTTLSLLA